MNFLLSQEGNDKFRLSSINLLGEKKTCILVESTFYKSVVLKRRFWAKPIDFTQ